MKSSHKNGKRGFEEKGSLLVALRERQSYRNRAVAALGVLVVLATAFALMVPAITMTHGDLVCDLEEHQHTDACYEQVLTCVQSEDEGHTHSDSCYEQVLACTQPEHVHTDACYAEPELELDRESMQIPDGQFNAFDDDIEIIDAVNDGSDALVEDSVAGDEEDDPLVGAVEVVGDTVQGSLADGADSEDPFPVQSFETELKDENGKVVLAVSVEAPEGALPAGAAMTVDGIDAEKLADEVEAAISYDADLDGRVGVKWALAAGISFTDADGYVIEPAAPVEVKLTSVYIKQFAEAVAAKSDADEAAATEADVSGDLAIVHVLDEEKAEKAGKLDEDGVPKKAEFVEKTMLVNCDEDDVTVGSEDTLKFEAEEFDPFVVVELEALPAEEAEALVAGSAELAVSDEPQHFAGELTDKDGNVILSVDVEAPAGALPEGVEMQLTPVTSERVLDAVKEKAADEVEGIEASRAEAVAADISFFDAEGIMVEPAAEVHVSMSAPAAAAAGSDREGAPSELAVVHVSNNNIAEVVGSTDVDPANATAEFDSADFSVYALVYTVDFHWEVDGKTFEFSIPGGGFVSLTRLVEALGIVESEDRIDSETASAESSDADSTAKSINARKFVADVAKVEFSNPSLVWVGKTEDGTTVGALKKANDLDCRYSADLTEQQVAEADEQTVEAGDWALISILPFASEETLSIFMKNGDQFVVKMTDAQKTSADLLEEGKSYVLYIIHNGNYYTLNSNGDTVRVPDNNLDALGSEYLWTYHFKPREDDPSQATDGCSWANGSYYLDVYWSFEDQDFRDKYNPVAPTNGGWEPVVKLVSAGDGGFQFSDVNDDDRYLYYDSGNTHIRTCHKSEHIEHYGNVPEPVSVHVYKQESTYTVTCKTDNAEHGNVRYVHGDNTQQTTVAAPTFNITTEKNDGENKQVPDTIQAIPATGYKFTGWTVINEGWSENDVINWGEGCTAESASIRPTVNGNLTLQANFAPERQYHITVQTNDSDMGTVGGGDANGNTVTNQSRFESISTAVINSVGQNAYEFTATKKPLHKFVKWELRRANGDLVSEYTTPTVNAESINLTEDDMTLTAVFAKKTETEIDNDDINTLLDNWKSDLTGDFVGVDKTAHVHDYENRIYEIDLTASSGKWAVERSINLDFITDTSRSMYFPANLEYARNNSESASTFTNLRNWLNRYGDTSETYYVISAITSSDSSATMYAVTHKNGRWQWTDSSYFYYIEEGTGSGHDLQDVPDSIYMDGKTLTGRIYKSSKPTSAYTSHSQPSSLTEYWSRLDYLYKAVMTATEALKTIDPNSQIHLTTFNKESKSVGLLGSTEQDIYNQLQEISPMGGTRQDRGLWTARTGTNIGRDSDYVYPDLTTGPGPDSVFENNSANQQFAIIVTDGAPNGARWNDSGSIIDQANALKAITDSSGKNLTLMTLGLGSDFVGDNKERFDSLASEPKYAENANNGGAIVAAIKNLVTDMVKQAELYGTVSDTLDPAFYPVDANDDPIKPGYYKNGASYTPSFNDTTPYYQWSENEDGWTITYYNQTFGWPEKDSAGNITKNGWEQSFYVKAKEDFMGGNTIETNGGTTFAATHTILLDDDGVERPETKREIKAEDGSSTTIVKEDIPTPHVNVKQLTLNGNETRWTVYTENTVYPPIDQIKELFNNIEVLEVVEDSTENMITSHASMLFAPGEGSVPETFLLKDVINVTDTDWADLMGDEGGDGTVDIPYEAYGHASGVIRLTLAKEGDTANYSEHKASSSPNAVERYVLTAQYVPYTVAEMQAKDADGGSYHTTAAKSPGTEQQQGRPSTNTHTIDLFTRGLSITKTDETFKTGLPGAEFTLYRPATAEEIASDNENIKTFDGEKYYPEDNLICDANGVAYKNGVKALADTMMYYLVETKAPNGYNALEEPIPVALMITNVYTILPVVDGAVPQDTKPNSGMFNWEQKAALKLMSESGVIRTNGAYNPDDPSTVLPNDPTSSSLYEMMYYRISNNPGYELPHTGGPGTGAFATVGALLIAGAGVVLLMRLRFAYRRGRRVA